MAVNETKKKTIKKKMDKKDGNSNKNVNEIIDKVPIKPYIIIFVIAVIFGVIMINGMNFNGYNSAEYPYEGGIVASVQGYEQNENSFKYDSNADVAYIQVPTTEEGACDKLVMACNNKANEDVDITVLYIDDNGNQLENVTEGIWKKGKYYAEIDIDYVVCNSYCLCIPADFVLDSIYYGVKDEDAGKKPIVFAIIWIILVIALLLLIRFTPLNSAVNYLSNKFSRLINEIPKNIDKIVKTLIYIVCGIFLSEIVGKVICSIKGDAFSVKVALMAGFLGVAVGVIVRYYKEYETKAEIIMGVIILASGSIVAFTTPSNVGISWDDEVHYSNVINIAHYFDGKCAVYDNHMLSEYVSYAEEKTGYSKSEQEMNYQIMNFLDDYKFYTVIDKAQLRPTMIAYLPSAIGYLFAKGLNFPYSFAFSFGKWMNVLLLTICCILAMKKLKTGKIVVMIVALIPTNIYVAGNYSYDTWLLAFSIYGLSSFFGEFQSKNDKITVGRMLQIAIPMFLAVQPKLVYFPLTLICLFMPKEKFENKKLLWFYRCLILLAIMAPFVRVYLQSFGSSTGEEVQDIRGVEGVNSYEQMQLIKSKPMFYFEVMFNFLKGYLKPSWYIPQGIENMTHIGYSTFSYIYFLITIPLFCLLDHEGKDEDYFPWWSKLGAIVVLITIGFVAATSMYVAYSQVGSDGVAGCQARYLLPAFFPFLYILSRWRWNDKIKEKIGGVNISIACAICMIIPLVMTMYTGCIALFMKG